MQKVLGSNVVELTFVRRHEKLGWNDVRGLVGTTNYKLLNSPFGYQVLHFQPPKGVGMGYDYKAKNLCVVWDMFRQEYRVFGAEQVNVRKLFSLETEEQEDKFLEWFYDHVINMSEQEKLNFMGYEGEIYAAQQLARRNKVANTERVKKVKMTVPKRIMAIYHNIISYFRKRMSKKG